MTKFYRASARWTVKVETVEVDRESENSVWINGQRRAKRSDWDNYFPTFDEAKAFVIHEMESGVDSARRELERAKDKLGNAKGLKEPQ